MKILLLGANGQLAKTIKETKPKDINLISFSSSEFNFLNIQSSLKNIKDLNPTLELINAQITYLGSSCRHDTKRACRANTARGPIDH